MYYSTLYRNVNLIYVMIIEVYISHSPKCRPSVSVSHLHTNFDSEGTHRQWPCNPTLQAAFKPLIDRSHTRQSSRRNLLETQKTMKLKHP